MLSPTRGGATAGIANSKDLASLLNERMLKRKGGNNQRLAQMLGMYTKKRTVMAKETIPNENRSMYSQERWSFFLEEDAPKISNLCCNVMKKSPAHAYSRQTGRVPITAEMADESRLRTQKWIQNGCNGFALKSPKSTPMAFWKEQDVLQYIRENDINICSVYGDIVADDKKNDYPEGQTMLQLDGEIVDAPCNLKTTGCSRTGCMYCGFGCHMRDDVRFVLMKQTHPKLYEWIMKPWEEGGLGYKDVIDWINEHGNLHIEY